MIPKRLEDITKADIDSLITDAVAEGPTIDYKRCLPGKGDEDKREFLADVSSFANGAGGDIVYGVTEDKGVPTSADGLSVDDLEKETIRLDQSIRNGIAPRINVRIRPVEGFPQGSVLIVRVPKSWNSPHMVTFKELSRFYLRINADKFLMNVTQIRSAFAQSGDLPERIRRFRDERLARIVAGETPVQLKKDAKLILHLFPLVSFTSSFQFDICEIQRQGIRFEPLGEAATTLIATDHRYNIDGVATSKGSRSYCQVFRSGIIETVSTRLVGSDQGRKLISGYFVKSM